MTNIIENNKITENNTNNLKNVFDNYFINKSEEKVKSPKAILENINKKKSYIFLSKIKNKDKIIGRNLNKFQEIKSNENKENNGFSGIFRKNKINNNEKEEIKNNNNNNNEENNNIDSYSNNYRKRPKSSNNQIIKEKKRQNKSFNLFKKYQLGNDIILPYNNINIKNNINLIMNFHTIGCYNKFTSLNHNINDSFFSKIDPNSLMEQKSNIKYINKFSDKKNKNFFKTRIDFNNKGEKKNLLNLNKNDNLILNLEINNFSHNNINKNQNNYKRRMDILSKFKKRLKSANPSKVSKSFSERKNKVNTMKKTNLKMKNYFRRNNKTNLSESHKIEESENKIDDLTYNKAKKLIDDPSSFIYILYNKVRMQKFDEEGNPKKLDLKKRFEDYKKDMTKMEQNARLELYNLKKQRIIGNEINMKGKIISTNTQFNLASIRGDY